MTLSVILVRRVKPCAVCEAARATFTAVAIVVRRFVTLLRDMTKSSLFGVHQAQTYRINSQKARSKVSVDNTKTRTYLSVMESATEETMNVNSYGMTEIESAGVMAIILHSMTNGARNVREVVVNAVHQVRTQDGRFTRLPLPTQMSSFISYAKQQAVNS